MHSATKVVIITESILLEQVAKVIEREGATGYTHVPAGGKGSRGKRQTERPQVSGLSGNVKFEIITGNRAQAERICEAVAEAFFEHYSGIVYLEPVEILRPYKFHTPPS